MRLRTLALSLLVLVSAPAMAAQQNAGEQSAAKYIESLGNQALAVISNKSYGADQKQAELSKLFGANVDFDWVGKFVMGRFWREATDDQKARYIKNYRAFLTKNYTSRFTEYTSGTFKVTDSKDLGNNEYNVTMAIASDKGAEPVMVDYKIRKNGGSFRVFDIIVEGVSMITTQRSEFGAVLSQKGIDALIDQLAAK